MKRYALTAIGRDKPGIVAEVTRPLLANDCNIEDSSMTRLQDEFAIILIMSADDDMNVNSLSKALDGVAEKLSLTIDLKEIGDKSDESIESTHLITVAGSDKAGIVHKTTDSLAKWGITITDLQTKILHGEEDELYLMLLETSFPDTIDEDAVISSLRTLGESMNIKIETKRITSYDAL